ncbi:hypothetical protein HRI_003818000 [Hibiscus trionum]|uniref:Endonuclease/exonuclease/phosphatase domain-containing protein n=1 Tax=Hibiscus trionum TaxID=183268 RepID=A0A9W7IRT6_HIBTR|nr:hypothetical protein HRI_003818000 [Hibiscus trionum]
MVKSIFWNAQRVLGSDFLRYFKLMVKVQQPNIVAVVEPHISGIKVDNFIRFSGFDSSYRVEATCFSGGIWVLWKSTVRFDALAVSSQFVHRWVSDLLERKSFAITFVYASPNGSKRTSLWDQLRDLTPGYGMAWTIGGDFNAIASTSERRGGSR